ncbi:MAG: AmmeMemoRadiSam system radical SAM enzyme [Methanosarcinaceae archaeon]|nr:AmmeMemoRadiSam system radical SAM enzyme [Methanosarcinaceae archaeon]
MLKEALIYNKLKNKKVQCNLCNHTCIINNGKKGFCKVRENKNGILYTLIYNIVSCKSVDKIEKKPIFHFYPGSLSYSIGTIGCNFRCKHCQNFTISQIESINHYYTETPENIIKNALKSNSKSISFTYNEPTIWHEFTKDCAKLAKKNGLATIYVTNGYMTLDALKDIAPYLDVFRVDIKAFSEKFYKKIASAKLSPVLESTKLAKELGMHIEIVYLIIPTHNDSDYEIEMLSEWIYNNIGLNTPLHFTRFYPCYEMKTVMPTPIKTLEKAHEIAINKGLQFVYVGNVPNHPYENTFCPECNAVLIKRSVYGAIEINITENGECVYCKRKIPIML